jgi:pimeloyl-ACP methyl ester carboxylesterase
MEDLIDQGLRLTRFPVLFIRGDQSDYVLQEDIELIRKLFPLAQLVTIKNAGHWLHAEQPANFLSVVKSFLLNR